MYDLLVSASAWSPVSGNQEGSYLTMKSNAGILFGGCTIASGFSGVFCDQGYWQRAIASRPKSTTKAYMLGGLSWFAIPWGECECESECDDRSRVRTSACVAHTPRIGVIHPSSVAWDPWI
jgi:Na+/proline symporter